MKNNLVKVLIIAAILVALFVLARLFILPAPGSQEVELTAVQQEALAVQPTIPSEKNGLPSKLLIPKLDIETDVQRLGITATVNMAAPDNFTDVSWYKYGPVPGDPGSAVIAGHEDNAISLDGVFKHLGKLEKGDDVYVLDESGRKLHYKVVDKKIHPYNLTGPALEEIFNAPKDKSRLNLITCTGDWLPEAKTNDKRIVVYTELVEE